MAMIGSMHCPYGAYHIGYNVFSKSQAFLMGKESYMLEIIPAVIQASGVCISKRQYWS